jgi:hypothetical protein
VNNECRTGLMSNEVRGFAYQCRIDGNDLHPDFVGSLSVNRRYHYPARTYSPFRSSFLQVDPLLLANAANAGIESLAGESYVFVANAPALALDPIGLEITDAQCHQAIDEAYEKVHTEQRWADVERMSSGFFSPECPPPTILCACCNDEPRIPRIAGGMEWTTGQGTQKIAICIDRVPATTPLAHVSETVLHEVMHWYDQCVKPQGVDPCSWSACKEIRAASTSGECDLGGSTRSGRRYRGLSKPPLSHREWCVLRSAIASASSNCPGKFGAVLAVAANFASCYIPEGGAVGPPRPQ